MKKIIALLVMTALCVGVCAQNVMRIGIIGLDTSHSTAFTELINGGTDPAFSDGWKVETIETTTIIGPDDKQYKTSTKSWSTGDLTVPEGMGFMYIPSGDTEPTVKW